MVIICDSMKRGAPCRLFLRAACMAYQYHQHQRMWPAVMAAILSCINDIVMASGALQSAAANNGVWRNGVTTL